MLKLSNFTQKTHSCKKRMHFLWKKNSWIRNSWKYVTNKLSECFYLFWENLESLWVLMSLFKSKDVWVYVCVWGGDGAGTEKLKKISQILAKFKWLLPRYINSTNTVEWLGTGWKTFQPRTFNPKLQPQTFQPQNFQPWTFHPRTWKVQGWKVWGWNVRGWNVLF